MSTLVGGQINDDTFLYVWTANNVSKLNRRNKITSPPLQLPSDFSLFITEKELTAKNEKEQHISNNNNDAPNATPDPNLTKIESPASLIENCKIILLRGVVKAEDEQDDPIGVFLQTKFSERSNDFAGDQDDRVLRCNISVTCTPVRPGGQSHSSGPEEFIFSPKENFKGMRSILPAVAIKKKSQPQNEETVDTEEARFLETSPVEIHLKIQFVKTIVGKDGTEKKQKSEEKESDLAAKSKEVLKEAASLFSGFTSSATSTLGSWWSAAATTSKEKVLPSMKSALSSAAEKAESLAQKVKNEFKSSKDKEQHEDAQEVDSSSLGNSSSNAFMTKEQQQLTPWIDIPKSYESRALRWQELVTRMIVEDQESNFLWAPESSYGMHYIQQHQQQDGDNENAFENQNHLSPIMKPIPRRWIYPNFTFSPEEELMLSQCGLSANKLLHCNDRYHFDSDVDACLVSPKDPWTQYLRQMRLSLVPRLVTEERFWAAYLWRVACLSHCINDEQEAIVKTLLSKPVNPIINPAFAKYEEQYQHQVGSAQKNDEHATSSSSSSMPRHSRSTSNSNNNNFLQNRSASQQNNSQQFFNNNNTINESPSSSTTNFNHDDVETLLGDASEALELLQEVIQELEIGDETNQNQDQEQDENDNARSDDDGNALVVASIRGAERSQRNIEETIRVLDHLLLSQPQAASRELWKNDWKLLTEMKNELGKSVAKAQQLQTAKDDKITSQGKKKNVQQQISKLSEIEEETKATKTPPPNVASASPAPIKLEDTLPDAKAAAAAIVSSSTPTKVAINLDDDDDDGLPAKTNNNNSNNGSSPKVPTPTAAASPKVDTKIDEKSKSRTPVLMPWEEEDDD